MRRKQPSKTAAPRHAERGARAKRRRSAAAEERAKDLFLETLSHELRTPLSTTLMQAQLLGRGILDRDGIKRAGEAIERAVQAQVRLIDDLVDVSRIVSGRLPMKIQPVDPARVVRAAIETVSEMAREKPVSLEVELSEPVERVSGDPLRLQQVVTNLLTNAVRLTPKEGRVTVTLVVSDGHARIRVANTGVGIEAGLLPYIFDPFERADLARNTVWGGLGLRLGIVRQLVERQGGTVDAESPGNGRGAVFTVTLPLAKSGCGSA